MADPTPWIAAEAPGDTQRRHAPATLRNRDAIADVLATVLPASGTVLEVASGSGEHCAFFAQRFPALIWQPSDPEPAARASIAIWCDELTNIRPALDLDAGSADWPVGGAAAVLCINMVHISPWQATLGLLAGAARLLQPDEPLFLYGPSPRGPPDRAVQRSVRRLTQGARPALGFARPRRDRRGSGRVRAGSRCRHAGQQPVGHSAARLAAEL